MYGRDEREDIGNQGEENVKALLAHHFGENTVQTTNGQDGHPDIFIVAKKGKICIEVKSMLPFSIDMDHNKRVHKTGYTHFNRAGWRLLKKFARGRIASVCAIVEVRFRFHPYIYFLLKREDIEEWDSHVKEGAKWADIPLWYIYERGVGITLEIPPEFDWTPLETNQVQMEVD